MFEAIRRRRSEDDGFRQSADTPRTLWHGIWYELAGEFDAKVQTRIAESAVGEDWTKGVALVDAAVSDGNSARALKYCGKTVDSCFRSRSRHGNSTGFDPATTPLFGYPGVSGESSTASRIIEVWVRLALERRETDLAGLLGIQKALFNTPDDWTAVRAAFRNAEPTDATALFEAWKRRALEQQYSRYGANSALDPGWVEWLVDAGFADRFDMFTDKATAWLREKVRTEKTSAWNALMRRSVPVWPNQMSLVADLLAIQGKRAKHTALRDVVMEQCSLNACPSRLEWLGRTDVGTLSVRAVEFIRGNIARLVPSPETMDGDYTSAAAWLAACREIAPDIARRTLDHWRTQYKRRRNLWRDLRTRNFDV